jgi:hypothetical protein
MAATFDFQAASAILKQKYSQKSINSAAFASPKSWFEDQMCPHGKHKDACLDDLCVCVKIHDD